MTARIILGALAFILMLSAIIVFVASTYPVQQPQVAMAMVVCSIPTFGGGMGLLYVAIASDD